VGSRNLKGHFFELIDMQNAGLTINNLKNAIIYAHDILDEIDEKLITVDVGRISQMVELANLSSMVGNLLGAGIEKYSKNNFKRNGPHKYPDILSQNDNSKDIEIKISLETNKPKGHLAKEGYYLTFRYVLIDNKAEYNRDLRGEIVQIWEARFGYLLEKHFNISNTAGDSGKTAVINAEGMEALKVAYIDLNYCPFTNRSKNYKIYQNIIEGQ
jgi:hypothetical protein